eukprot:CAMPEP_0206047580 /NCGR_PEP_ID=MMETSP1466-20131121/21568_1 /ASSEMBLY_ACC=CAM_ASM_001126 /TAXON_ID=44452 /ORGANISM="Pavlova gyrans, Strain CCMP608" /LENGTH=47 /DNA_ID= /DNA_START= /DNA_END= /DNA_ORIENTATION=
MASSKGAGEPVPGTALRARPLQHLQVTTLGSPVAGRLVPGAALSAGP